MPAINFIWLRELTKIVHLFHHKAYLKQAVIPGYSFAILFFVICPTFRLILISLARFPRYVDPSLVILA